MRGARTFASLNGTSAGPSGVARGAVGGLRRGLAWARHHRGEVAAAALGVLALDFFNVVAALDRLDLALRLAQAPLRALVALRRHSDRVDALGTGLRAVARAARALRAFGGGA